MQTTFNPDKRRLLSCLSHGSIFFSTTLFSFGVPFAINLLSDDPVVKANAKESMNFHLNVWFWAIVIGTPIAFLSFITFGLGGLLFFPVIAFGFLLHWGLTIVALLHCIGKPDEAYRYPFIFRLL
ncbi:DUF4870 domain-containing protein [Leptolyngbya boryana CZ1]|uniref:DUF4870 domain-containing protein n=1 Tax=Leptolyngbya boryana CZ1 TaxID=3060204 RepID=A0AA97API5_LEPBY|nr:DUF4870 domain-containing protein [Leptolyngbya boryana]WNZ45832.1 DUF4870 domain-containing protein [Leptolyngbya boryana CZ1]